MSYTLDTHVDGEFDDVVSATIDALEDEGFGVLCDIDVQATFAEKLDEEFRQYRILGACNPSLPIRDSRTISTSARCFRVTSSCTTATTATSSSAP